MFKGQHHESRKSLSLLLTLEHAYCKKSQLLRGTFCFTQVQGPNALTTLLHLADDMLRLAHVIDMLPRNRLRKCLQGLRTRPVRAACFGVQFDGLFSSEIFVVLLLWWRHLLVTISSAIARNLESIDNDLRVVEWVTLLRFLFGV